MSTQAKQLRALMARPAMVIAPGIYDGMSARLGRMAGFDALYATGGGIARSTGVPDINLIDPSHIVQRLAEICDAVDCPVIGDADTGYGNALNAYRVIRQFARIGLAGVHLEDQTFPKRCGHLNDKSLVPAADFVPVLKAAKDADPDIVIIARTDAVAVEGFDAAVERAHRYAEAGADVLFIEAPTTLEQIERIPTLFAKPVLINMFFGGKTPLVSASELERMGYRIEIIPSDAQRAAIRAMQRVFATLQQHGEASTMADDMATFDQREAIVATADWFARGAGYEGR
ncbi:MAG: isocitrate lyase/PEP mutase family protein [Proteobacteria bacterium]|nr:isocitrate lyase/PEP mutase family protein [Burkholderiales bacterium]